ncbi:helix-turn-helix domain-containing protein [Streptomyces sp. NPDC055039]
MLIRLLRASMLGARRKPWSARQQHRLLRPRHLKGIAYGGQLPGHGDVTLLVINGLHGMGGVFTRWLTDLNTRVGEFTPDDVPTLASVTLDLLASTVARCLEAEEALSPETRRIALRTRINTYIEQHLADPDLTPQTIADAHHISLRHLQQLLAEDDTSPAAWLRHRRLERCRFDLADPRLYARPIRAVAARWGFTDPAHFSRLFRAAYGIPPRDYRDLPPGARANRQHTRAI